MSDYTPTTEQALGDEIARVRHGQDVTASDLANRLMPWLAELTSKVRADEREKAAQIAEREKPTRQYTDAEMLYMVCLALEEGIDGVRRIDLDDLLIKMIAEHWGTADEDSLPDEAEAAFAQLEPYIPEFPDWGRKIAARIRAQGS